MNHGDAMEVVYDGGRVRLPEWAPGYHIELGPNGIPTMWADGAWVTRRAPRSEIWSTKWERVA